MERCGERASALTCESHRQSRGTWGSDGVKKSSGKGSKWSMADVKFGI